MRAISCLLLAAAAATGQNTAPVLTPEQALQVWSLSDLEFSPAGDRLALAVKEPAKGAASMSHIWMLHVADGELRQWTASTKKDTRPRWSPDGKYLAFLSDREERTQLYLMRPDGGEALKLTDGKNAVSDFRWSPDSSRIAFLAGEPKTEAEEKKDHDKDDARVVDRDDKRARIWIVDLASRKARQITKSPWKVQELWWLPDQERLLVKATDHPESDQWSDRIYAVRIADGSFAQVGEARGPFGGLRPSPDGRMVAYLSTTSGPSDHDLFVLPVEGGQARNLTGALLDRPIRHVQWTKDGAILALTQNGFGQELQRLQDGKVERLYSGFHLQPSEFASGAQGHIALVAGTATSMPELWLSTSGGEPKQISHFHESWRNLALRPIEVVKYPSADGVTIEAGLVKPAGYRAGARLPLVVLVHGGPTGAWTDRFHSWTQLLAARGYLVLCPNVRGSTGYGEKFLESNRADWGGGDFKDVMAGVDWLVQRGDADPDRLAIGGWSYGGYMAEWAITQTNRFRAAVAGAGLSDLASEFGTEQNSAYDEWFFGPPYEHPEAFLKSSPIQYIRNARTPTLILQGEADTTDPIGQSQQLYRGLKRYGVKTDLVLYPREGHGIQEEKHALDVLQRMLAWFDTYLKPAKESTPVSSQ